jgi:ABC-type glycerol-3-phosphate transport system substrate-binding protein
MRSFFSNPLAAALLIIGTAGLIWLLIMPFAFPTPDIEGGRVRVTMWYMTGAKEEKPKVVKAFNESQDSILVVASAVPWREHERKILTTILGGKPPDIIAQTGSVAKWARRGALIPLNEFIERDSFDLSIFFPALVQEMSYEGKIYGIPIATACYCLFYNKATVGDTPPPKTWEELTVLSERFSKYDSQGRMIRAGFIPNYSNFPAALFYSLELGAKFLSSDGKKVMLCTPPVVQSFEWTVKFYEKFGLRNLSSLVASFSTGEQHGFIKGDVVYAILDNTFGDQIKLYAPEMNYGVAPIPTYPKSKSITSTGAWWYAIPRGAKHSHEAWKFLKFVSSKNVQLTLFLKEKEEKLLPSNRMVYEDSTFLKCPNTRIYKRQMENAVSPTFIPLAHDAFWREYTSAVEKVIHHVETPKQALKEAEKNIQNELDKAMIYDEYVEKYTK